MGSYKLGNEASVFIKFQTISGISKFLVVREELMSLSLLRKKPVSAENTVRLYYLFSQAIGVR
jgi:hypothetical protein